MIGNVDWATELPRMLKDQDPENLHLDYKERRGLLPPSRGGGSGIDKDKRATDISKDVSSFLNSDGGVLVYGIRESEDPQVPGGAPIPETDFDPVNDGYDQGQVSKELLENLITSNIEPRPGPDLFHITEVEYKSRLILVVEVAAGLGAAWQAKDLRYYRRFHYKEEPMEHYEIEMVRARGVQPQLEVVTGLTAGLAQFKNALAVPKQTSIHLGVRSTGGVVAQEMLLEIGIFDNNRPQRMPPYFQAAQQRNIKYTVPKVERHASYHIEDSVRWYQVNWGPNVGDIGIHYQPLFSTLDPIHVGYFDFIFDRGVGSGVIGLWCWRIQAPGMPPKQSLVTMTYTLPGRLKIEHVDWHFEIENTEN